MVNIDLTTRWTSDTDKIYYLPCNRKVVKKNITQIN